MPPPVPNTFCRFHFQPVFGKIVVAVQADVLADLQRATMTYQIRMGSATSSIFA
jgi:hypothetical protein